MRKLHMLPSHPERICWGCDRYCPAKSLACGNGSERTMHPAELFGEDWCVPGDWGIGTTAPQLPAANTLKPLINA